MNSNKTELIAFKADKELLKKINKAAFDSGHTRASWIRFQLKLVFDRF